MAHRMNISISPRCRAMLKELAKDYGSMSRVIEMAVTEFYNQQETQTMHTETKNETTYYVHEDMLGDSGTEAQARRMVELLQARGFSVEYGPAIGQDPDTIPAQVWGECLEQL